MVTEPLSHILFQAFAATVECAIEWHLTTELTYMGMSLRKYHEMYHCKVQSLICISFTLSGNDVNPNVHTMSISDSYIFNSRAVI